MPGSLTGHCKGMPRERCARLLRSPRRATCQTAYCLLPITGLFLPPIYAKACILFFFSSKYTLFFRAVLDSQQNGVEGRFPTYAIPHTCTGSPTVSLTRAVHLLQLMNLLTHPYQNRSLHEVHSWCCALCGF